VYTANAAAYLEEMRTLDAEVRAKIAAIPEAKRLLVTAHDAFGYFGRAYGIEVRGIQGISTEAEASLKDINTLVDDLVARKVPAVFVESSVPRKTIEALIEGAASRGHTLAIGGELFSDAMGAPGTPEGTYLGMVRHNVEAIAGALK
jgi:manganese/zinc/iron transport system substrate-binding protein